MTKKFGLVVLVASLAGCGGLEIESLTPDEATNAHSDKKVPGYIVYHPMIVVEMKEIKKEILKTEIEAENIITREYGIIKECVIGKPQTLPDYEKPFLLRLKSGIGKSSVDLKIEDGWRLAGIKTESDNTAWLKFAKDMATGGIGEGSLLAAGIVDGGAKSSECKSGLYKLSFDNNSKTLKFERIKLTHP